jgi:adenylate cyclase
LLGDRDDVARTARIAALKDRLIGAGIVMVTLSVERRLAAILSADVVGYSRLMGEDEAGTLARLKVHRRELVDPAIERHHGRIVKLMGDGALVEFPSVVDAVACAVEIQRSMAERNAAVRDEERIEFRIGITLGDVIVEPDDIYGDGVNVAARLQALAEPGGIYISRLVQESVRGKLELAFDDLGEQRLKNIAEPVRAYRVRSEPGAPRKRITAKPSRLSSIRWLAALAAGSILLLIVIGAAGWHFYLQPLLQERAFAKQTVLPLPDKPSIAVLPFANMSGDAGQDYFSDGMTENLITNLSKVSGLFVIARNSVFTYKGRPVKVQDVGRELGVRYVLEGSVQKASEHVRIHAQLIDAATGFHLWAEQFDRRLDDLFALQDDVANDIIAALQLELTESERQRLANRYTKSIAAYDYYLRGEAAYERIGPLVERLDARRYFQTAIDLDPDFALAYARLALTYTGQIIGAPDASLDEAWELAQQAMALDGSLPQVYVTLALVQGYRGRHEEAIAAAERAIALDPNYADGYVALATVQNWAGQQDDALEAIGKAMRLNPRAPGAYLSVAGQIYFHLGRYDAAIATLERVLARDPNYERVRIVLAATFAHAGRLEDAEWQVAELLTLHPELTLDSVREAFPQGDPTQLQALIDGLLMAGFREHQ